MIRVFVPTDTNVLEGLPHGTSFAQRRFFDANTNEVLLLNVVLMGIDRTSIRKPAILSNGKWLEY